MDKSLRMKPVFVAASLLLYTTINGYAHAQERPVCMSAKLTNQSFCRFPNSTNYINTPNGKLFFCCTPEGVISSVESLSKALRFGILPGIKCTNKTLTCPIPKPLCC